eukprot:scaffold5967_cov86-Skeletonema_marinoi.AAC.1
MVGRHSRIRIHCCTRDASPSGLPTQVIRVVIIHVLKHYGMIYSNSAPLLEESRYSEFKYSPQASSPMELDCLPRAVHYHLYNIYNTIQDDPQNLPKVT